MPTANLARTYDVDVETMWSLWTDPEHLGRWFRPSVEDFGPTRASVDLRDGGAVRFEMIRTDGNVYAVGGRIVDLEPPHRISYTWTWDDDDHESVVTIALTATDGGTTVEITHTRLRDPGDVDRHADGWNGMLASLAHDVSG